MGIKDKKNEIYLVKLVECDYIQISSADCTTNYSPTVHNVILRHLLALKIVFFFTANTANMETAFVYGNIKRTHLIKNQMKPLYITSVFMD